MMNYEYWDDDGDENGKKDESDDDNAATGSVSDGLIFDPIKMHRYRG